MSDGPSMLEQRIAHFEELLEQMREETREAHSTLKQIREVHREVKHMLETDVKEMVELRTDKVICDELEKIGPQLKEQTSRIYARVGREVDKIIDISLGKEFSDRNDREDLRPRLAEKLREWLREIIDEET